MFISLSRKRNKTIQNIIKNDHINTAILVFAQSAQADAQHKTLARNKRLMDVLNERVLNTVEKSGFDYFLFTENEQKGIGFGNRFSNAIQQIFKKGYEQVICIGNDTPQLHSSHIKKAANSLNKGIASTGPSLDGGFYLMGIHASQFDPKSFENLPWQTSHLAASYHKTLEEFDIKVDKLERLLDLDSENDISQLFQGKDLRSALARLILGTLAYKYNSHQYRVRETKQVSIEIPLNKGSPALIAA